MIQRRYRRPNPVLFVAISLMTANATFAAFNTWYVDPDTTTPLTDKVCSVDQATPCDTDAECAELGSCILLHDPTTSWCKAAISLQDVLKSAELNDTIKVADGTYRPDPTGLADPRDATFRLPSTRITVEGGYAGCGAIDPDARDFIAFESVLSGDIGAPDDNSDNCLHVVTGSGADNLSVLDGFSITAGNANGSSTPDGVGGGMLNDRGSPTVRNCTLRNNTANRGGGGVYNKGPGFDRSTPRFVNCIVKANVAGQRGGGVRNVDSNSTFTNCLLTGNRSNNNLGGAMSIEDSDPVFANCTIVDNFALAGGGGISFTGARATVFDSIVWGNSDNSFLPLEQQQLGVFASSELIIDFSCVQGCDTGSGGLCQAPKHNIGDDPRFVPGPLGCYYLSDTAAGEPFDSACIDSGGLQATDVVLEGGTTLAERTTQSGETRDGETGLPDSAIVDMGYHYRDTAAPVDPDTGLKFLLGDQDRNGVVDLFDYDEFVACLSDPDVGEVTPCCRIFDYELDGDVDLQDFAEFQMSFLLP